MASIRERFETLGYAGAFGPWEAEKFLNRDQTAACVCRMVRRSGGFEERRVLKAVPIIDPADYFSEPEEAYREIRAAECQAAVNEVRVMYELQDCPHIVRYLDYRTVDWSEEDSERTGCDLLVLMEALTPLAEQRKGPLSEGDILTIGQHMCRALAWCHGKHVLHRDVKPENIFRNSYGAYLLGDFGIARILEGGQRASTNMGTYPYMAPEQVHSPEGYDHRADLCGLGLTLYTLCNQNRPPFCKGGEGKMQIARAVMRRLDGEALPPLEGISRELDAVIRKACAHRPEDRYQSAEAFLAALNGIVFQRAQAVQEAAAVSRAASELGPTPVSKPAAEAVPKPEVKPAPAPEAKPVEKPVPEAEPVDPLARKFWEELKKAEAGDAMAQCGVSNLYLYGSGTEKNLTESAKWLRRACEQGLPYALCMQGDRFAEGAGVPRDDQMAVAWYRQAADKGYSVAYFNLGKCYFDGKGVAKDRERAFQYYLLAANNGNPRGQVEAGHCYLTGTGTERNSKKAVELYQKAEGRGLVNASFYLGLCYFSGRGVPRNYEQALWYFRKIRTAKVREQIAGTCFFRDEPDVRNFLTVMDLYDKMLAQDDLQAQYELGRRFYSGDGVPASASRAVDLLSKAAERGHGEARSLLPHAKQRLADLRRYQ